MSVYRGLCTSMGLTITMLSLASRVCTEEIFNDVILGDDITLSCGEPCEYMEDRNSLEWKKNGEPLSDCGVKGRFSGGDSSTPSLEIRQLEMCDIATYTCCCSSKKSTECTKQSVGVLVFRGASGRLGGSNNIYELWASSHSANTKDDQAKRIGSKSSQHYKSDLVKRWNDLSIDKIKLAVHKNGEQGAFFIFNGRDTTKLSWMKEDRLMASSFTDIGPKGIQAHGYWFSMGDFVLSYVRRRFFMNKFKNSCTNMYGWLAVVEKGTCDWEKQFEYPSIFFSPGDTSTNWIEAGNADELTISIVAKEKINEVTTVTNVNTDTSADCDCPCKDKSDKGVSDFWASLNGKYTQSELKDIMEPMLRKMKKELTVDKNKLSSYKRKHSSASDNRKSSQKIGIVGTLCISFVISVFILIDIMEIRRRLSDIRYICGRS